MATLIDQEWLTRSDRAKRRQPRVRQRELETFPETQKGKGKDQTESDSLQSVKLEARTFYAFASGKKLSGAGLLIQ